MVSAAYGPDTGSISGPISAVSRARITAPTTARAQTATLPVAASFSIVADLVRALIDPREVAHVG